MPFREIYIPPFNSWNIDLYMKIEGYVIKQVDWENELDLVYANRNKPEPTPFPGSGLKCSM